MQLRVSVEKFTGENEETYYENFSLKDQVYAQNQFGELIVFNTFISNCFLNFQTLYKLNLGEHSGSGCDSLSYHNGGAFSTIDRDNDEYKESCAENYSGAWWYKACHYSNLNGINYGTGEATPYGKGIVWRCLTGHYDSLKSDIMAIRPKN